MPVMAAAMMALAALPMVVVWTNTRALQASVMVQQMRRAQAGQGATAHALEHGVALARTFDAIDPLTAFHAAMIMLAMGKPDEAADLMHAHLGDFAHAAPAVRLLLRARATQGRWHDALLPARMLLRLMPHPTHQGGRLHWAAGRALDAAGKPAAAQRAMLHGLGLGDEREQLFLDLSAMAHASAHHALERAWIIRALRITPRASTIGLLERWYEATGDREGLRRALELARDAGATRTHIDALRVHLNTAAAPIDGLE